MKFMDGETCAKISAATLEYATGSNGGPQAAGRIVECIIGAALPMVESLFHDGEYQDRLLFALVLAGACGGIAERKGGVEVSVSITPGTLREAFAIFTQITGKKIQPHLPKVMLDYAAGGQVSLH